MDKRGLMYLMRRREEVTPGGAPSTRTRVYASDTLASREEALFSFSINQMWRLKSKLTRAAQTDQYRFKKWIGALQAPIHFLKQCQSIMGFTPII